MLNKKHKFLYKINLFDQEKWIGIQQPGRIWIIEFWVLDYYKYLSYATQLKYSSWLKYKSVGTIKVYDLFTELVCYSDPTCILYLFNENTSIY